VVVILDLDGDKFCDMQIRNRLSVCRALERGWEGDSRSIDGSGRVRQLNRADTLHSKLVAEN
jgi:hypothetical protein